MTLDFEPDQAEVVGLLQPFVDGELSDDERALVAQQIAHNPEYQAIVREQQEVRAMLRELEREAAPSHLRASVLAGLDEVDEQQRAGAGKLAPLIGRISAFGRGALLMVPAAAAAVVLFVVAGNAGWLGDAQVAGPHVDGGMANSLTLRPKPSAPEVAPEPAPETGGLPSLPPEELGFSVQIAPPRTLPQGVALVSDNSAAAGSSAMVRYHASGGAVIVDHQRRAGVALLRGTRQVFREHEYHLGLDDHGRPRVEFQLGRVHHSLVLEGGGRPGAEPSVDAPEFRRLLIVADALRSAHGG